DEVGSPTYTIDLARGILALLGSGESGLFHLAGAGACSRYELACEVLRAAGMDREVRPVLSAEFPSRAPRPHNSVLDCSKAVALGVVMPPWQDAVRRYIATV
ncbi:MAG: sugar nucleotide-binding protein, partial [Coriobacteriales bacterium]